MSENVRMSELAYAEAWVKSRIREIADGDSKVRFDRLGERKSEMLKKLADERTRILTLQKEMV